jgi:glycosyltransferase involved in cell wall biosynthesis
MGVALRHAQALRFTSQQQLDEIVMRGFTISQHHIVAPVPLNISSDLLHNGAPEKRPVSVGFVGRIHEDRGLNFFLDFVKKLQAIRQDFSVIVAGDGSMREFFLSQLNSAIGESRINYLGDLSTEELAKSWEKIGALINSAPAESFGRTLREALANGVPVIALDSNGVRNALEGMQQNAISIYSSETSDLEIDALFKTALGLTINQGTKTAVLAENEKNTIDLVQDWIYLMHVQQKHSAQ